jgi:hypothetical protein
MFMQCSAYAQDTANIRLYPSQRVTNTFASLAGLSKSDKIAVEKAVQSLEAKGIYEKLITLNIGKYFDSGKCYNVITPFDYDGAFILTVERGTPQKSDSGIVLKNGDMLNTHFINDRADKAPFIGMFWYTDVGVNKPIIASASPFNIEPRYNGKAYVNIWSVASGVSVPQTPAGFCLAQRVDASHVEFYQGSSRFSESLDISTNNPQGNETLLVGNNESDFTLKAFGITEALTEQEVTDLKQIIDQLLTEL